MDIRKLFEEVDKSSGEVVNLTPNGSNTVQPVALMRLGVFVPTLKSLKNSKKYAFPYGCNGRANASFSGPG
ncbi:hypothetical protein ECZC10_46090 [Escherichia coli]|nr:hypothetical protein ECZC10_46090 [Escherichia coli]